MRRSGMDESGKAQKILFADTAPESRRPGRQSSIGAQALTGSWLRRNAGRY
jgi:hypothetical protein